MKTYALKIHKEKYLLFFSCFDKDKIGALQQPSIPIKNKEND